MKKLILLFLVVFSFATAAEAQSALTDFVSLMNKECPEDLGDGMVLKSVSLERDNVVFTLTVQDTEIVEAMSQMPDLLDSLGTMMISSMSVDESMHMMFSLMVQEKKNLVMRFTSPRTVKVATMTIKYTTLAASL